MLHDKNNCDNTPSSAVARHQHHRLRFSLQLNDKLPVRVVTKFAQRI
jgi:hypothetical protein